MQQCYYISTVTLAIMKPGLGTRLRHLLELLDGDVARVYVESGLPDYRPRYTPIVRALEALGPTSIKAIAEHAGISHSAASQTVAQMRRAGLLVTRIGSDARERHVAMSAKLDEQLPQLRAQWRATTAAGDALDAELSQALTAVVDEAIAALERKPFRQRIGKHLPRTGARSK